MNFLFHCLNEIFFGNLFVRKVIKYPVYHETLHETYSVQHSTYGEANRNSAGQTILSWIRNVNALKRPVSGLSL